MSQSYVFKQFEEFHFIRIDTCVPFYNDFSPSFKESGAQNVLSFPLWISSSSLNFLLHVSVTSSMHQLDFMVNAYISVMSDSISQTVSVFTK